MGVMKREIEKKLDKISRSSEQRAQAHFEAWWMGKKKDASLEAKRNRGF